MTFIGITGLKKSGKSTFADFLRAALLPTPTDILGFADALKDEVSGAAGVGRAYIEEHKDNFRLILQGWGTDFRRNLCGDDYWIVRFMSLASKLKDTGVKYLIVPDVRFLNEANAIIDSGGQLIRIARSGLSPDKHQSEAEMAQILTSYTIDNNKDLASLKNKAIIMASYIKELW